MFRLRVIDSKPLCYLALTLYRQLADAILLVPGIVFAELADDIVIHECLPSWPILSSTIDFHASVQAGVGILNPDQKM